MPRHFLAKFLTVTVLALLILLLANLLGYSPAIIKMERVRVVAPPVSQFSDRPWERNNLQYQRPAPPTAVAAPSINVSVYTAPAPPPTVVYQLQPAPQVTVLMPTPLFTYGGPPPGYYGQQPYYTAPPVPRPYMVPMPPPDYRHYRHHGWRR